MLPAVEVLFVDLAEDPPGSHDVEEAHDNPGILAAEVLDGVRRVADEALPGDDLDPRSRVLALLLQVLDRGNEHLLGLLQDGDSGPAELLHELDARRVVDDGRRMRAEQRREAPSIGERGRACAVAELRKPSQSSN